MGIFKKMNLAVAGKPCKINLSKLFFWIICLFTSLLFLFIIAPEFFTACIIKRYLSFFLAINEVNGSEQEVNYGLNGDSFGVLNPFIALLAAGLTFIAFWVQYQANQKMLQESKQQQAERQFYEMLRIHQENVEKFKIETHSNNQVYSSNVTGHEAFRVFNYEFYFIYKNLATDDKMESFKRAYKIFFFGKNLLTEKEKLQIEDVARRQNLIPVVEFAKGHVYQLDHYYRHLYHIVKLIATSKVFSEEDKQSFLKIIRAQMTSVEQILLLYKWLVGFGKKWECNENQQYFFSKYRMIHNIIPSDCIFSEKEIFDMFSFVSLKDKEKMFEHFQPEK